MSVQRRQINYPLALWRRKWLILPFLVLGAAGALVAFSRMTPLYRAEAVIALIPQTISESIYPGQWAPKDRVKAINRVLDSTSFLEAFSEEAKLEVDPGEGPRADRMRRLIRGVTVREVDPETFVLASISPDPRLAAEKANTVARVFVRESQQRKVEETEGSARFLQDEVERVQELLAAEKTALARYQAEHKGELPSDRQSHRSEQVFMRQKMGELDAHIETKSKDLADRRRLLANPSDNLEDAPLSLQREDQLKKLRQDLASARLRYTERHPEVVRLKASIESLEEQIRTIPPEEADLDAALAELPPSGEEEAADRSAAALTAVLTMDINRLRNDISEMKAERKHLEQQMEQLEDLIQKSFLRETEIDQINARINILEAKLAGNQNKLQALETEKEVFERGMDERYELKAEAGVPLLPFKPDLLQLLLIGIGIGAGAGVGLALLLELLDQTIWTAEDLEELLQAEVLAVIPSMEKLRPPRSRARRQGQSAVSKRSGSKKGDRVARG